MSREQKKWHQKFINYMNMIITHPNYKGLCIKKKSDGSYGWIATAKSAVGKKRIEWCLNKAKELKIPIQPGVYADVMLAIHPTKIKVCQTCGKEMSLYYHYPNANFLKLLNKKFNSNYTDCDHINDIWDNLINKGIDKKDIATFLIDRGGLSLPATTNKEKIIDTLEYACRKGGKKCLGPGAMSNFPDRFDGFHTYNRCCRSNQDKGRSKENLKSYSQDRRAYEYWSDGNIHAANQFMGSPFFKEISADHIGPISLGFVHDPRYLQQMSISDNSSKRDRLQLTDIKKIIETENRTKIYPMSWYSHIIWEYIKKNYIKNPQKVSGVYRDALKQNMTNFMYILLFILKKCPTNGEDFLTEAFLAPNYKYFDYSYTFKPNGEIINKTPRHFTGRNECETERYRRIALESISDYNNKENRHMSPTLTPDEISKLKIICERIATTGYSDILKKEVINLIDEIQQRAIRLL